MASMEDASTWASATVVMAEDGTCKRHPHILLREKGEDGYIYQKEICELCQKEYQENQLALKAQKKELDRQLEQLGQEDEQIQNQFDSTLKKYVNNDDIDNLQSTLDSYKDQEQKVKPAPAPVPAFQMAGRTIPADDPGYTRNPLTLESLASQMTMMQQMQDWMLNQKESEMNVLRQKVDKQQKELNQKDIEIALLKEKLSQQEVRMQQELKLLKIAAMGRNRKGKEIHIQELHVSVGGNIGENGEIDPKMVQAATAAATEAAIEGANKAQGGSRHSNRSVKPPPIISGSGSSSDTSGTSNLNKAKGELPAAPPDHALGNNVEEESESKHEEDEGLDTFPDGPPAWPKKPAYPVKHAVPQSGLNSNRNNPMDASFSSIDPNTLKDKPHQSFDIKNNSNSQLPTRKELNDAGAAGKPRGTTVPSDVNVDDNATEAVPESEEVTIFTTENYSKEDEKSMGNTVASSTYGEDRQKVVGQVLLDPYGDKGKYSGVVLRSTGMPHGVGRMVYEEDQRTYEGDWRHGRWHGFGRATFANGDSYEGEYRFDQRHGRGKYCWSDGRIYDGQFSEDKRHGKGTFKWPDGAIYDGDFVQGQREGHGQYTFSDGGYYTGNWVDGRYEGFGECHWEDGRQYIGEWRSGMAHGNGIEKYPDGRVRHDGQWINDEPVREK